MIETLLLGILLLSPPPQTEEITFSVQSLKKSELPDDFPFQVLDQGFAIFKITIENRSPQTWTFQPDQVETVNNKGKALERATVSEITPKVLKLYRGNLRGIYGEGYSGGRPTIRQWDQVPTVSPTASAGTISASRAPQLRALLEHYEIKKVDLDPGASYEGFLYLKSKKTGRKLSGSVLRLGDQVSVKVP
ncbi:hypothetical protein MYX82_07590 [Acidobacteria bacterium AH-259-D05]|nr:hypothetical protein [Acidobacteria bacterium AH-259-D05]